MELKIEPRLMLTALLRPIIRFCLKKSLKLQDIEQQIRSLLIEEAKAAVLEAGGEVSSSKLSVITGVNRAEVGRLTAGKEKPRSKHDILNRVVGLWRLSKKYADRKTGSPRSLTYQGVSSEFATLASEISKELSHYTLLYELERSELIEIKDDRVFLKVVEYTPRGDIEHGLAILADDIQDVIETVESNLSTKSHEPDLHLRTVFDRIEPQDLPAIRAWVLAKGAAFHKEISDFLASYDRDVNPRERATTERARVVVTSFALGEVTEPVRQLPPKRRGRKKRAAKQSS